MNITSDYASDFHLFRIEWLTDQIKFFIDDQLTSELKSPDVGFAYLQNIGVSANLTSEYSTKIAPFDTPVIILTTFGLLTTTRI